MIVLGTANTTTKRTCAATRTARLARACLQAVDFTELPEELTIHDGDARSEVERLISLGASRIDENTLADPDGNEFRLLELDD